MSDKTREERQLFRVQELVQLSEFDYLTEGSLRHLIFNSETRFAASGEKIAGNGLADAGAIIRIGRRVLIDAQRFRAWVEQHRTQGAPTGQSVGGYHG